MKERKPDMRFKGYEDSWIEKPFGEVFDTLSNNTLSRDKLNYDAGSIMDVHYGDILIKFGEILDTEKEGLPFITNDADAEKYQAAFLRDGDIVVADTAEDETVGKCTEICNVGDKKVLSGLHTIPYRSKDGFATGFLGYYLNSGKYHDKLLPLMQGVKVTSISKSGLNGTNVIYPKSKKEQALIGGFLFALDEKINSESIVCEKLKILKKAMLGKMFPSNGSRIPEIRFSGFTEPWEQRKLGDICESFEYGLNAASKEYDGENKYIRITDIDDSSHEFLQEDVTSPDMDLAGAENYRLKYGDILFARTGASVGKTYIYKDSDGLVYYAGFLIRGHVKNDFSPEFVFQNTLTDDYNRFIRITSQRSGQPGVNAQEYAGYEISAPSFSEQQKIGLYFSYIDHLITLHQQKVGKLINIKAACMRRLFV